MVIDVFPFRADEGGNRSEDGVDDVIDGEKEDKEERLPDGEQEMLPFTDDDDEVDEEAGNVGSCKQRDDVVAKGPPIEITGISNCEEQNDGSDLVKESDPEINETHREGLPEDIVFAPTRFLEKRLEKLPSIHVEGD